MNILGIQFAPLNVPMNRRLQTLAAAAWFVILAFGGFIGLIISLYLVFFTRLWWLTLLYYVWIYLDRETCEKGGRPSSFVRSYAWWDYLRDYFPLHLKKLDGVELDPKRNYLFCAYPHGMLSTGVFGAFATEKSDFRKLFPHHEPRVVTLSQHYAMPFCREMILGHGGISCTAKSINYMLSRPGGGYITVLMPGGAQEAYYCRPGLYRIILNKRKGFVKLALKTGAPLVPVISFGETDLFEQVEGPKVRKTQEFLRKWIGLAPVLPIGRGFFQYSFGIIPRRSEIFTVVGKPIEVEKNEDPSNEEIDALHKKFVEELSKMFEEQKHLYLKNPEGIHLEIE